MKIDQNYLIRLKNAGKTDEQIAARFECSVEEVQSVWNSIIEVGESVAKNGYANFQAQFLALVNQYSLLGESLKSIGNGIGNFVRLEDLSKIIAQAKSTEPDKIAAHLLEHTMVLYPFVAIDPEKSLGQYLAAKDN